MINIYRVVKNIPDFSFFEAHTRHQSPSLEVTYFLFYKDPSLLKQQISNSVKDFYNL